jgi:DNA-binding MarR family transcriptional regulator/N-acetylglutamate synthase-like GNAT family acetyltransferase
MTATSAATVPEQHVAAVRGFNRFYTQRIGVLREHLLDGPFSLTAVRVLYELAHWPDGSSSPTAAVLAAKLGLDEGYLSRLLRAFEQRGLIRKTAHLDDGRQKSLALTASGRRVFAPLEARSRAQVASMLARLALPEQAQLVEAMHSIESLLGDREPRAAASVPYFLRSHRPGDIGWVIHRHGVLYASEYGYDERFEALVAGIAARFIERLDPERERCWIAEMRGEIVGSVFLVRVSKTVAKLRLLLVEPRARGLGIGARLVDECVRFARDAGYRRLVLWTQSDLDAARHIYARAGFKRTRAERHRSFGKNLVAETWELPLRGLRQRQPRKPMRASGRPARRAPR